MIEFEQCELHAEPKYFEIAGEYLCAKCYEAQTGNHPISNLNRMENYKTTLISETQQQFEHNKSILLQWVSKYNNIKENVEQVMQKNMKYLNQYLDELDKNQSTTIKSLETLSIGNVKIFAQEYERILKHKMDFKQIQIQFENCSSTLINNISDKLKNCSENLILNLDSPTENEILQQSKSQSRIQSSSLKCQEHLNCEQNNIVMVDLNPVKYFKERLVCVQCMSQKQVNGLITINDFKDKWQKQQAKRRNTQNQCVKEVEIYDEKYLKNVSSFHQFLINDSQSIISQINELIDKFDKSVKEDTQYNNQSWKDLTIQDIKAIAEIMSQQNSIENYETRLIYKCKNQKNQLKNLVIHFLDSINFESKKCKSILECENYENKEIQTIGRKAILSICRQITKMKFISLKKFSSKSQIINFKQKIELQKQMILLQEFAQKEWCLAMVFNEDSSKLFAASGQNIKVFEFNQGQIQQQEILKGHEKNIFCLIYLSKSKILVSGGLDCKIIIWDKDYQIIQKLEQHSFSINCMISNQQEDLLISGSSDDSIVFWRRKQNWVKDFKLEYHEDSVQNLSLSKKEDVLISIGFDNLIVISQYQYKDGSWEVIITVETDQQGLGLQYIDENSFVFIPKNQEQIQVYQIDLEKEICQIQDTQQIKNKESQLNLNPIQTNNDKSILVGIAGQFLNVLQRKQNKYQLIQSLQLSSEQKSLTLSKDGKFIIVWDSKTKSIYSYQL